jgi:hypothetical protein
LVHMFYLLVESSFVSHSLCSRLYWWVAYPIWSFKWCKLGSLTKFADLCTGIQDQVTDVRFRNICFLTLLCIT